MHTDPMAADLTGLMQTPSVTCEPAPSQSWPTVNQAPRGG